MKCKILVLVLVGLVMATAGEAEAKTDRKLTYRSNQIWSSAVRFLRVEQSFKILEKDKEASYLLFEYRSEGKKYNASLEMIDMIKNGKKYVRVRITIPAMPSYVEAVLADKFLRKMRDEYGPAPEPTRVEPEVKPDAKSKGNKGSGGETEDDEDLDEEGLEVTEEDLEEAAKEN